MATLTTARITQSGTATGTDHSATTTLHLLQGVYGVDDVQIATADEAGSLTRWPLLAQDVGTVDIIHPSIMWGDREEIIADIKRVAWDHLIAAHIIQRCGGRYTLSDR